jgi:spore maturation protein CgeB
MTSSQHIVIFGLSLSSSWGNGHATTYRALVRALAEQGHRVSFFERDVYWYAYNRDLPDPNYCELILYSSQQDAVERYGGLIDNADAVIVGSYVPEGIELIDRLHDRHPARFCFYDIDTPVTLADLDRRRESYIAGRQIPLFDIYFSFCGGGTLERLERGWGARQALPLFCSVDPDIYRPTGEAAYWDLGYLGTYSPDRQPTLEALMLEPARQRPELRFVVAGPQYPDTIDWPANVDRIDHLPPADHPSFYGRQRFTLNVTRADMIAAGWSPSVRLFEAAACGTSIISDDWPGLDELLPDGRAIVIAREPRDVISALTALREPDRRRIADTARTRILQSHTNHERARQLVAALEALPADSRSIIKPRGKTPREPLGTR